VAILGEGRGRAAMFVQLNAPAVEFDLMRHCSPRGGAGRKVAQRHPYPPIGSFIATPLRCDKRRLLRTAPEGSRSNGTELDNSTSTPTRGNPNIRNCAAWSEEGEKKR
jgi:hypothetical protein